MSIVPPEFYGPKRRLSLTPVGPVLKLHLEPDEAIDIGELTAALGSLSRQYQQFAAREGLTKKLADGKLLVSSVSPGSIDINFLPDIGPIVGAVMPLFPELVQQRYDLLVKFAKAIKSLLDFFLSEKKDAKGELQISLKECDDALNIVNPIAQHGGSQSFTVVNGSVHTTILTVTTEQARQVVESSQAYRGKLLAASGDKRERVAMVWSQLARDAARVEGKKSPDRGIIEEIDPKPHPVFFTDEMSFLKGEMIDDEENPYQKVFFVDVEISRVPGGGIGNYRITHFHGKDDFEPSSSAEMPLPFV